VTLTCGCPVAERAWVIPDYFAAIARQTVRPDAFVFVVSNSPRDDTARALRRGGLELEIPTQIIHDDSKPHIRQDGSRFVTLARLRNALLDEVDSDVFMSLDSDVLLGPDDTIERLLGHLDNCDLIAPRCSLHPDSDSHAVNAGLWIESGDEINRRWARASVVGGVSEIDIPMAAWMARTKAIAPCRYRFHESGEDLGFAQDLDKHHVDCLWDDTIRAVHVWGPESLQDARAQVQELRA
jgi:hypothetical protein